MTVRPCKYEKCRCVAADGDDFCSTRCAKIFHGTLPEPTEEQRKERRNQRRRIDNVSGPLEFANPFHNIDRHEGPAVKRPVRRRG